MLSSKKELFIFGGPSLELIPNKLLKTSTIFPPIQRGDLENLMHRPKPALCLIVDGLFGATLSVTPTECRQLLEKGWMVFGCSSMGALRAADLWSLGMIGFGSIYNLYRLGYLKSDADVAVIYETSEANTYKELTASMVHIRFLLKRLHQEGILERSQLNLMLLKARQIFWVDRTWDILVEEWSHLPIQQKVLTLLNDLRNQPEFHPKKLDAQEAAQSIAQA